MSKKKIGARPSYGQKKPVLLPLCSIDSRDPWGQPDSEWEGLNKGVTVGWLTRAQVSRDELQ